MEPFSIAAILLVGMFSEKVIRNMREKKKKAEQEETEKNNNVIIKKDTND